MRTLCFWMLVFYVFCNSFLTIEAAVTEKRCAISVTIQNHPKQIFKSPKASNIKSLEDIKKCTIIDGDFSIHMMPNENLTNADFPVFNNLKQISGNLLIYYVFGLTNLGHIFPNLKIIGGQSLISNNALVVFNNQDLRYIGLNNLRLIRNGGVRITDNPKLCYSQSINWNDIIVEGRESVMIDRNGYDSMFSENGTEICQDLYGCNVNDTSRCQRRDGLMSCWNSTTCQTYCPHHKLPNNKIGPGCTASGVKCHSSCLGGCEVPNDPTSCYACQKFELNGQCVDRCPPDTFQYLDNRCLTKSECHALYPVRSALKANKTSWKAFDGKCRYDCPVGYQEDPTNPHSCIVCEGYCPRKCLGGEITTMKKAKFYEKCNIIEGNLKVYIENAGKNSMEEFTKAFGNIREITGYLLIHFSPTFTSLHMFKSLEIIHGEELFNNLHSLLIAEMENLQQLFKQNITIKNGTVNFQNNPKLCYSKIMDLVNGSGLQNDFTDEDIPKYSNGNAAICDAPSFDVEADYLHDRMIEFKFKKFNTTNLNNTELLGYTVYYKKVDKIDYDMVADNSDCQNPWKTRFVPLRDWNPYDAKEEFQSAYIDLLEPNTIYAYYIQTKVIAHPEAKNAISKIGFYTTPFKTPDAPILRKAEVLSPNKVVLEWDPPVKGNGNITHYTIMWNAKSIRNNGQQDACGGSHSNIESTLSTKFAITDNDENLKEEKSQQRVKNEIAEINEQAHDDRFEDDVLNFVYSVPSWSPYSGKQIEYNYFDQYTIPNEDVEPKEVYPEIYNENITFGRANISTTRVILTGLHHLTEYYIQIIACQDITVPENHCSKQAATRIIRTKPIPEKDIIDSKSIKVFPYIVNGTEQGDSRLITWKIPEDPNGAILGFRIKLWIENDEFLSDRCITKADYDKFNGTLFTKLKNGIYSFKIQTISSGGISEAVERKNLFEIHVSRWLTYDNIVFVLSVPVMLIVCLFMICRYYNQYIERKAKKYAQKIIASKGQGIPLL